MQKVLYSSSLSSEVYGVTEAPTQRTDLKGSEYLRRARSCLLPSLFSHSISHPFLHLFRFHISSISKSCSFQYSVLFLSNCLISFIIIFLSMFYAFDYHLQIFITNKKVNNIFKLSST